MQRKAIENWISRIEQDILLMQAYHDQKRRLDDWHGVMDAAADIRELQITQRTLRQVLEVMDATV